MDYQPKQPELNLIRSTLSSNTPRSILQIGLGCHEYTKAVIETVQQSNNCQLTILSGEPDQSNLERLQEEQLDHWADIIQLPSDQVLPDFYFQAHRFDLAIINSGYGFDETLIATYYINKMLKQQDLLIVNGTDTDDMRPLCRHLLTTDDFKVAATSESDNSTPLLEKLVRPRYEKLPDWIKQPVETLLHPSLIKTDASLGLHGKVIVFEKVSATVESPTNEIDSFAEADPFKDLNVNLNLEAEKPRD